MNPNEELDLAEVLGAEPLASQQLLSLYIPNKDRHGKKFNPKPWCKRAAEILLRVGEGATIMPPCDGVTVDDSGRPLWEKTTVVYAYVTDRLREELPRLRRFLHRFGRETDPREVVVELAGAGESWFFRIKQFDEAS